MAIIAKKEEQQKQNYLTPNAIYCGDARELLPKIKPESIALSFWSPPYFVGKPYEQNMSFEEWQALLSTVIKLHFKILIPGGFLAINIADILCFPDPSMPRVQFDNVAGKKCKITREDILRAAQEYSTWNRYELAKILGCSEQTIDRRLKGNNIRGGKHAVQTKVKLVGGLIEKWGETAGFYLYDRRVWVKSPAWMNCRWHSTSYKAVDEFEYLYIFWKPGATRFNRNRLTKEQWREWGSRGVWFIPSVRANDDHPAKFPHELARRIILLFSEPGDIVLDPFVGSGTTAVAAILENRQYIGIDIVESYVHLAREKCSKTKTEKRSEKK